MKCSGSFNPILTPPLEIGSIKVIYQYMSAITSSFILKNDSEFYVIYKFDTTRFDINIVGDNNTPAGNYR